MKATELMIGDWVGVEEPSYVGMVTAAGYGVEVYSNGWGKKLITKMCLVQPIPLTAEIMEKNGWRPWCMTDEGVKAKGTQLGVTTIEIQTPKITGTVKVQYVHELQHALRLAGIEKEVKI